MTKQLIIDIERLPGKFEGTFWGPNDMKNRRIPPDWVTRDPRTICFAWKWKGERKIDFVSEWDDGPEAMAKVALDLYIEADIVTGHNIKGRPVQALRADPPSGPALRHPAGRPAGVQLRVQPPRRPVQAVRAEGEGRPLRPRCCRAGRRWPRAVTAQAAPLQHR